jgi:hypothetical protein
MVTFLSLLGSIVCFIVLVLQGGKQRYEQSVLICAIAGYGLIMCLVVLLCCIATVMARFFP